VKLSVSFEPVDRNPEQTLVMLTGKVARLAATSASRLQLPCHLKKGSAW